MSLTSTEIEIAQKLQITRGVVDVKRCAPVSEDVMPTYLMWQASEHHQTNWSSEA